MNKEIEITEGYTARIEGNKVILEPKESVDEKIRKAIIELVKQSSNILYPQNQDEMLAYLERQKEKPKSTDFIPADCASNAKCENEHNKPGDFVFELRQIISRHRYADLYGECVDDEEGMAREIMALCEQQKEQKEVFDVDKFFVGKDVTDFKSEIFLVIRGARELKPTDEEIWLNIENQIAPNLIDILQKEQKPAEWSEEVRKEDLRTRFAFYTYKDEDSVLYLSNVFVEETSRNKGFGTKILQAAEMVAQTIGALTIRLKVKQNTPVNDWYRRHGYGYLVFEDDYDWLEKNLEYLKPKQEWSETDKLHLNNAILVAKKEWGVNSYTARWLESLRDNYKKCNSRWKPSEEQMWALDVALENFYHQSDRSALESLKTDLQKL